MIILRQKRFGNVEKSNKAKKRAWENKMAGIKNPDVKRIIDNPDNPLGFDQFVYEDFDYNRLEDSRNSRRLRELDHKIRQSSGNRKMLNPEYAENIEKKTKFREEYNKPTGDTINKKFQKKKRKIIERRKREQMEREMKREAERIAEEKSKRLQKIAKRNKKILHESKKIAKIALPIAAISGLGYLGYKKYKKSKEK